MSDRFGRRAVELQPALCTGNHRESEDRADVFLTTLPLTTSSA
jgi:hypothetical protein